MWVFYGRWLVTEENFVLHGDMELSNREVLFTIFYCGACVHTAGKAPGREISRNQCADVTVICLWGVLMDLFRSFQWQDGEERLPILWTRVPVSVSATEYLWIMSVTARVVKFTWQVFYLS